MHALVFKMKRAHLRALAGARALSLKFEVTPARYDLMRAVCAFGSIGEQLQHRLWKALGVSRITVSKMVRRLMELGLVQRRRAPRDKRTFLVSLTREGGRRMHRAWVYLYRRDPFQRRFERAFGDRSWATHRAVTDLIDTLERTNRHFGDTSWPLYLHKTPGERVRKTRGRGYSSLFSSTRSSRIVA
jgi:DNA-binding MarR family transcriptional regulator